MKYRIIALYLFLFGLLGLVAFAYLQYENNQIKGVDTSRVSQVAGILQKEEVEKIIAQYIKRNPDLIINTLNDHHRAQQVEYKNKVLKAIQSHKEALYNSADDPRVGSGNAPVKIVEFFDYGCGYCKRMSANKAKILAEYGDKVEYIFKEFPILGHASSLAAKAGIAAYRVDPGKYLAFHRSLLEYKGIFTESKIYDLVKEAGIDVDKFKQEFDSEKVTNVLKANHKLAASVGIRGTPTYIIGDKPVLETLGYEEMKAIIDYNLKQHSLKRDEDASSKDQKEKKQSQENPQKEERGSKKDESSSQKEVQDTQKPESPDKKETDNK